MRPFLRKWWRLLAAVALFAVAVQLFVRPPNVSYAQEGRERGAEVFRPVYAIIDSVRQGVRTAWTRYIALIGVERENEDLRKEVSSLREKVRESGNVALENERLKRLLDFSKTVEKKTIGARVIGHDISPWFQGIFINAGTDRGIRPGMAVITPEGAVGRTYKVYGGYSEVLLLSDGRFAADVIVERTRVKAIAEGMGGTLCRLKYVSPTQDVTAGDRILFSGFDGIMPKGTLLGTVLNVDRPREGIFLKVQVVSAVRFDSVEEVLVIRSPPSVPFGTGTP
jgi:rod shape-determining protein MreC